jgi:hypothetical protein
MSEKLERNAVMWELAKELCDLDDAQKRMWKLWSALDDLDSGSSRGVR